MSCKSTWKLCTNAGCDVNCYCASHSTETTVLRVLSDILGALDCGDLAVLMLFDLSAAFDTFDHETLLQHLETSYRIHGAALNWLASYLHDRQQFVRCRSSTSIQLHVLYGVHRIGPWADPVSALHSGPDQTMSSFVC